LPQQCLQAATHCRPCGWDTTSALYGHGKASVFKNIVKNKETLLLTETIGSPTAARIDIIAAGLKLLILLYGGNTSDTINNLRYVTYMNLLATCKTQPNSERLPPSECAAQYHILRVHFQVIQWQSLMEVELNADEWGWKIENDMFVPIKTDIKAAPDDLLNIISCKCQMVRKNPCSSQLCSCQKHGLQCVAASI